MIGRKRAFAIGCVHLRLRLVHYVARAEPARPALRLVVPRRRRRGADPARDRRPRRGELPGRAPARRLRPRRRRGCDRGRGRAADRRLLHHVLLVALGLRRRGRDRARDPPAHPPDRGRAGRGAPEARSRRGGPVGARAGAARLRRPPLQRVGLDPAEARRARLGGSLADRVADPCRTVRDLALLPLAGPRRVARRRAARAPGDAAEQAAQRRARRCSSSSTSPRRACSSSCRSTSRSASACRRSRPARGSCLSP